MSIKNWMGPYQRTPQKVARAASLRLMGSHNWWFSRSQTPAIHIPNPSKGRIQWFLGLYKLHEITHFCWTSMQDYFAPKTIEETLLRPNNMRVFLWLKHDKMKVFAFSKIDVPHLGGITISRFFAIMFWKVINYPQCIRYLLLMDKIMHHLGWLKPYK